ncbi:hypothetical protein [Alkalilimnicola sp. S0819]|uniref:hypothetical protein n=1 Tax=Alkalilimnicola sp. S0819 TaxID=2613922 RepID=UPI0012621C75|nr:hypothetical protein [Alkalilimnicola sp. S0819]KAB7624309.1 hypothetical protein F3N43_05735 [Alkalilimnicola sp. S0819]MPQ16133.1 hypothetical protein [Alkalilimnicola sp. S0819]
MALLGTRDLGRLQERGIKLDTDGFGQIIEFTPTGLAWLLNFVYAASPQSRAVTLGLLKAISGWARPPSWRELRYRAVECSVYDDAVYYNLMFYLNGSPPKLFSSLYPNATDVGTLVVPASGLAGIRPRDNQEVRIMFSDAERQRLLAGDVLVAGREEEPA